MASCINISKWEYVGCFEMDYEARFSRSLLAGFKFRAVYLVLIGMTMQRAFGSIMFFLVKRIGALVLVDK